MRIILPIIQKFSPRDFYGHYDLVLKLTKKNMLIKGAYDSFYF